MRLDEWIVRKEYLSSRSKANRFIREHGILINGIKVNKPSHRIISDDTIELDLPHVQKYNKPSGYHKFELLANNLRFPFSINSNDVCLDIGASAGGFSLFMLEHGAKKVHAIEISQTFEYHLKELAENWPNFSYEIVNFFEVSEKPMSDSFSLITADLTLDPYYLLQKLYLFPQLLKNDTYSARILLIIKTGNIRSIEEFKQAMEEKIRILFLEFNYFWLESLQDKKEVYLLIERQ